MKKKFTRGIAHSVNALPRIGYLAGKCTGVVGQAQKVWVIDEASERALVHPKTEKSKCSAMNNLDRQP